MEQLQEQNTDPHVAAMVSQRFEERKHEDADGNVYTTLYAQIPMACCRIDLNGFILDCNELLADLFLRSSRADLLDTSIYDLIDPPSHPALRDMVASFDNSKKYGVIEIKASFKRGDGNPIFVALRAKPIRDELGNITALNMVIIDETLSYLKIESIEKDKEELEKKERMKDEFIAVASHELRTPIQPLLGFALLAKRGMISEEKAWDGVLAEARRLQQLTNDILDVTRIESNTLNYERNKEKIRGLMEQIVEYMNSGLRNGVSIVSTYNEVSSETEVEIDRPRITQVITNIIGNAIKFTQEGSITVETKVYPEKNLLEIAISDTGKGIPNEIMPRLFEKFATKGHGDGQNKGSGLGLYISKAIVKAHGGQISGFNNSMGGATFVISLPIIHKL